MSNLMKKAIKASFLKLLDERPLTRITVVDIAADCGINRNSFYYHYHDIPSLMEEIIRDETDNFIRAYPDISTLDECVDAVFSFILENRRSISHIYHSVKREVFEQYLMSVCSYVVRTWYDSVWLKTGAGADPVDDGRAFQGIPVRAQSRLELAGPERRGGKHREHRMCAL